GARIVRGAVLPVRVLHVDDGMLTGEATEPLVDVLTGKTASEVTWVVFEASGGEISLRIHAAGETDEKHDRVGEAAQHAAKLNGGRGRWRGIRAHRCQHRGTHPRPYRPPHRLRRRRSSLG